jgi:hypothetical protein
MPSSYLLSQEAKVYIFSRGFYVIWLMGKGCPPCARSALARTVARLRASSARENWGCSGLGVIFLGKPRCVHQRATRPNPAGRYTVRAPFQRNSGLFQGRYAA